jgi:hypothetical protein
VTKEGRKEDYQGRKEGRKKGYQGRKEGRIPRKKKEKKGRKERKEGGISPCSFMGLIHASDAGGGQSNPSLDRLGNTDATRLSEKGCFFPAAAAAAAASFGCGLVLWEAWRRLSALRMA